MAVANGGNKTAPAAATVTSTAASVVADNPNRRAFVLNNSDSTNSVFLGSTSAVTASGATKGIEVKAGIIFTDTVSRDAWYAITASASVVCPYYEVNG